MKIATRLMLLVAMMSAVLVVVGGIGLYSLDRTNESAKTIYDESLVTFQQLETVERLLQRNRILVMDMLLVPDATHIAKRNTELEENIKTVSTTLEAYQAIEQSEEEKQLFVKFQTLRGEYVKDGILATRDLVQANKVDEAKQVYADKISPLSKDALASLSAWMEYQLTKGKNENATNAARYATVRNISIAAIVFGVLRMR